MALSNKHNITVHVSTATDPLGVKGKTRTVGTCACGRTVEILYDDTECGCGRCYNLFGQELKSHAQRQRERCDW